jgi:Mn2+/Fe2+ NRAMP family transporter
MRLDRRSVSATLRAFGPGIVTGSSDDDPSGIGTYAQVGAQFGYGFLWTALATFPLMAAVQYMSAKIGLVTGRGLAGVLSKRFPAAVVVPAVLLLAVANTINLGVDIGAIAAAVELVVPIPAILIIVPVTAAIVALLVWGSYAVIARAFKWLTLALLAYVGSALLANPDWTRAALGTFIPTIQADPSWVVAMVAVLGTTISPYLFFYQAEDEVEDERRTGGAIEIARDPAGMGRRLRVARLDVASGMLFSNVVMYFIVLATAATLHESGITQIATASDAAKALEPLAGVAAEELLAIGLIGSGVLAVPILGVSASYAIAEVLDWPRGLDEPVRHARRFYALVAVGMVVGMLVNFVGIDPITALFWTAVLNGLAAPPLLWLMLVVANDRKVTAVVMSILALAWVFLVVTGNG